MTCEQKVVVNDLPPTISCPSSVTETTNANECILYNVSIPNPTFGDNCGIASLTWTYTDPLDGDVHNSPATGINYVGGQAFETGVTTVTYTVTDNAGLTATCSFTVTIIPFNPPVFDAGCPPDPAPVNSDATTCDAYVSIPVPDIDDPCGIGFTVTNDRTGTNDASGRYPVGTTTVTWTITPTVGSPVTCEQKVVVNDLPPTIVCPDDVIAQAEFDKVYKSGITVGIPTYADNCPNPVLSWVMVPPVDNSVNPAIDYASQYLPEELSGTGIFTGTGTYYLGVTTIYYTITDAHGNKDYCDFTITVLGKPEITCVPLYETTADPGLCTATLNSSHFGLPTLDEGVQPITWTWTVTAPNGTTVLASGSFTGSSSDPGPPPVPNVAFPVGTSTITWRAQNISGFDECTQQVIVTDEEAPTFTPQIYTACVDMLNSATYVTSDPNPFVNHIDPNLVKNPSPDYHTFTSGMEDLDIQNINDNCCDEEDMTIHWRIDFTATPDPLNPGMLPAAASITGSEQPSTYGNILFPGDGVTFTEVIHTITFWVVDCNGNRSLDQVQPITITPRPQIIKVTGQP